MQINVKASSLLLKLKCFLKGQYKIQEAIDTIVDIKRKSKEIVKIKGILTAVDKVKMYSKEIVKNKEASNMIIHVEMFPMSCNRNCYLPYK